MQHLTVKEVSASQPKNKVAVLGMEISDYFVASPLEEGISPRNVHGHALNFGFGQSIL
jgi:hypothetical protein